MISELLKVEESWDEALHPPYSTGVTQKPIGVLEMAIL